MEDQGTPPSAGQVSCLKKIKNDGDCHASNILARKDSPHIGKFIDEYIRFGDALKGPLDRELELWSIFYYNSSCKPNMGLNLMLKSNVNCIDPGSAARLAATAAFLLSLAAVPLPALAEKECGDPMGSPPAVTCSGGNYATGISYTKLTGGLTLSVVPPSGGTTVNSAKSGITVQRPVGVTGEMAVNVGAGTKIGTPDNPVGGNGIDFTHVGKRNTVDTGKISVTNAGSIHARKFGIKIDRRNAGDIAVTNSGSIVGSDPDSTMDGGIHARARVGGKIVINNSGSVTSGFHAALFAWYDKGTGETEAGSVEITSSSGVVRSMERHGILVNVERAAVPATVTVTGGAVHGKDDGIRATNKGTGSSTVRVSGSARIESSDEDGIHASAGDDDTNNPVREKSKAAVLIDLGAGSRVVTLGGAERDASHHGLLAEHFGNQAVSEDDTDTGSVTVNSAGVIRTAGGGHGIAAFAKGSAATVPIAVRATGGSISAAGAGIHVENMGQGMTEVTVGEGATVTAERDGIYVDGSQVFADGHSRAGERTQTVTVRGKVTGGSGTWAGVHMVKGGTVVIGPKARVSAASGTAIKANDEGDMTVILEMDERGLTGLIDGTILNTAKTTFKTRVGASGAQTTLDNGATVDTSRETKGVYDEVHWATLETLTDGSGQEFRKMPAARVYHDRARVYEALPSMLVELNGQTSWYERMAAARDSDGVWARVGGGDGKRKVDASTTSKGRSGRALSQDVKRWDVDAGFDKPLDDRLTLGVSAHHRQGEATVKHGGKIKASGTGLGLSAAYTGENGLYVDGQLSWTRFGGIELNSDARGKIASDRSGTGYAASFEAGKRMVRDSMTLTPRGGFVLSSVNMDDFDDVKVKGAGKVSLGDAQSFRGRLGVLAEKTGLGGGAQEDGNGRAFASLDVEHEFSPERSITASGTALASEVKATWFRLGAGGAINVGGTGAVTLSGEAFYATAGSGNAGLGGTLTLGVRF